MNNTFDVQILVNGSRCKQYQHEGKTFIQANPGSEYVIEIKNNYWKRIEAVAAVDGLNVLSGKAANEADTGYIVDAYHSEKIKGFRFSDDEWALFKFGYKMLGGTYAQSKEDGSEKNCGVIGLRLFYEYEPQVRYIVNTNWYSQPTITTICDQFNPNITTYTSNVQYGCRLNDSVGPELGGLYGEGKFGYATSDNNATAAYSCNADALRSALRNKITAQNFQPNFEGQEPRGFDMGTEWGKREKSKITTVSFSRGYLAHSLDIYYASRESLIEMGVPVINRLKVNLPQSFPDKYATPPQGWVG